MADNELLIKINADAKNANKAFEDMRAKTEDLESTLKSVALISGAAFAALTAEIYLSVAAFEEAQRASIKLTNALQNQGIYTDELKAKYEDFANIVQEKTGIDNDAIIKAQAVAQTFLGQTEITQELTSAIADLSETMGGDLDGAAEKIARTIGTGTNAFARQGLVIREGATEAERYAKVMEFVRLKAGGLAEEMNRADGYSRALTTAFGNFQEALGERFAPIVAAVRRGLVAFFEVFTNNPWLVDFAAAAIAAGAAVSGIIAFIAAAVPAFLALKAAAITFGIAFNTAFVGIPLLIGAVVAGVTLLALNWDKTMRFIKTLSTNVVTYLSELFGGFGQILSGAFNFDGAKIQKGLNQLRNAAATAQIAANETYTAITESQKQELDKQNADKKAAAEKAAAIERQHQANLRAIRQGEIDLLRLQVNNASAEMISLKQKEIETLKALDANKSAEEIKLLRERYDAIKALQEEQQNEDLDRALTFEQLKAETKAELEQQGIQTDATIREEKLAQLRATALTEADIERNLQEQVLTTRIAARNRELEDRKKYGVEYAKINKFIQSDEVQGAKSAAEDLVALQQSKNATLKSIGKVAAVANITVATAESAMNIYRGFSTIPIIGPALGVAGAAAAIAFGAERIGQVTGAAQGGLMEGGVPGRDSIPVLAQQGELIAPRKNFDEVVNSVAASRNGGNNDEVLAALQSIDQKLSNPQPTTVIQGDVQADDSYIDALIRRINDAVELRNQRLSTGAA